MTLQAGFIFLAPAADFEKNRQTVDTPEVSLTVIGAKNYADAVKAVIELERNGVHAIELCGGFGIEGVAKIKRAVSPSVSVGVVRFDQHPGLGNKSGDELFTN